MTFGGWLLAACLAVAGALFLIPFMEGLSPRDDLVGTIGCWLVATAFVAGGVVNVVQS